MSFKTSESNSKRPSFGDYTIDTLPKTNVFTSNLPSDPQYPTPQSSHQTERSAFLPRIVRGALYTHLRPDASLAQEYKVLSVSEAAMRDLGLREGEQHTSAFGDFASGRRIFWSKDGKDGKEEGVYPWAQCYGGWQFGQWAGQLGDGRAVSIFETPCSAKTAGPLRYEVQLKGCGRTPYSRFADGKAVLRSSLREYVISEALDALGIPTTRALALTLLPKSIALRERVERCAITVRFAPSWLRIGTFDNLRARGDLANIRRLATFFAEHVVPGSWAALPAVLPTNVPEAEFNDAAMSPSTGVPASVTQTPPGASDALQDENRFARLYRWIVRQNAVTVAYWQAYGFINGVLNTDNTSLLGLSLDFGPFAFLDDFDRNYTPNHDDDALRYSYKNQPSVIWWNLLRLGEDLGPLIAAGADVDIDVDARCSGGHALSEDERDHAEAVIKRAGIEFSAVFLDTYRRLMCARLGLRSQDTDNFLNLYTKLLDMLETCSLDYNQFFIKLANTPALALRDALENENENENKIIAGFFHSDAQPADFQKQHLAEWLRVYVECITTDYSASSDADVERAEAMRRVNPCFLPRAWVLDEVVRRVEMSDFACLERLMAYVRSPFEAPTRRLSADEQDDDWERWAGEVPASCRKTFYSCSS